MAPIGLHEIIGSGTAATRARVSVGLRGPSAEVRINFDDAAARVGNIPAAGVDLEVMLSRG